MTARTILGVPIQAMESPHAVDLLDQKFSTGTNTIVAFANAHTLNVASVNSQYRAVLQGAIVLNDGIGVDLASRILYRAPFPANLNGTDFNPFYLRHTKHVYRIYFLGARPGIAEQAAQKILALAPQHHCAGYRDGYFSRDQEADVVAKIAESKADIILVAMGNPQQELWLARHLPATGCRLGFGVGALFDFAAGEYKRAPQWVQGARMEWAYRLMQEPSRLWQRYMVESPIFLSKVFASTLAREGRR